MNLDQRTALIVGGGQTPGATIGNGRATAIAFAKAGAKVAVADRKLESAEETAQQVIDSGGQAIALQLDVLSEEAIQQAVSTTCSTFGGLDILHNNVGVAAGAGHRDARIEQIEAEDFSFLVDVNLRGMVLTSKHALKLTSTKNEKSSASICSIRAGGGPRSDHQYFKSSCIEALSSGWL